MKFLVVDDHALIREALQAVLRDLRPGACVLEAADAATALQTLQAQPDVDLLLLDLQLPDQHGLQVLATVVRRHPAVAVVMLSGTVDPDAIRQALQGGAQGFIPKTETRAVLSGALSLVLAGGVYLPPVLLSRPAPPQGPAAAPAAVSLGLTDRQLEVLALLMQGQDNKRICRSLGLAEPTVKNHVSAILKALGVGTRTEAVLAVTRLGWTHPPAG